MLDNDISPDNIPIILDYLYNEEWHVDLIAGILSNETDKDNTLAIRFHLLNFLALYKGEYFNDDAELLAEFIVKISTATGILDNFLMWDDYNQEVKEYLLNNVDLFQNILSDNRVWLGAKFIIEGIFSIFTKKSLHTFTKSDIDSFFISMKDGKFEPAIYLLLSENNCREHGWTLGVKIFNLISYEKGAYGEYVANVIIRYLYQNNDGSYERFIVDLVNLVYSVNKKYLYEALDFRFYDDSDFNPIFALQLIVSPKSEITKIKDLQSLEVFQDSVKPTFTHAIFDSFNVNNISNQWNTILENFIAKALNIGLRIKTNSIELIDDIKKELDILSKENSIPFLLSHIESNKIDLWNLVGKVSQYNIKELVWYMLNEVVRMNYKKNKLEKILIWFMISFLYEMK